MLHQALSLSLHIFSFVCSLLSVSAVNSVIYIQCSQLYFTSNQSYELNLNSLFTSLAESASDRNFNTFNISPPGYLPDDVVYGLSQCRGDLSSPDCRDCVANSVSPLKTTCPVSIGGAIQSEGCLVKYNNTISPFGFEDTTEVFKSCGPSIGYNSDVMNHIDEALAYLVVGNGEYFRSGSSGSVHGVAQCEEDLTPSECDNCIVEARARLRSECETSTWGDMHLGTCYIRYNDHQGIDDDTYNDNQNKPNCNDNDQGCNAVPKKTDIRITPTLVGIILSALIPSSGVTYYISLKIRKDIKKYKQEGGGQRPSCSTSAKTLSSWIELYQNTSASQPSCMKQTEPKKAAEEAKG